MTRLRADDVRTRARTASGPDWDPFRWALVHASGTPTPSARTWGLGSVEVSLTKEERAF